MDKVKLSEIANIRMGQSPEGNTCNETGEGTPLLNGPTEFTNFHPIPKQFTIDPKRLSEAGDILFCVRGSTTGRMNWSDQTYAIGRGLAALSHKKGKELNYFLKYLIHYNLDNILNSTSGSTFPNLTNDMLASFELLVPDISTQQKIAAVLSALDAKIELNARINAELESMAKTLYDYWFVQFKYPHPSSPKWDMEALQNNQNSPVPFGGGAEGGGGLIWNEALKREIPLGWEVVELSDIANITMGQSPPGESYNEDGEGMIFFQGCTDFGNRFPSVRQFTTQPTRFAKAGDILLSVRAPVGTINIAKEDCCIGRGLAALNSKDNANTYLFEVMRNLKQVFERRNVNGTTFGSITKDDLFSLKVLKPSKDILEQYQKIIQPTFEQQNKLELESQTLTELRDWLLPMLMNGQVTIQTSEV